MIRDSIVWYVFLIIIAFSMVLNPPWILAKDKDKPVSSPVFKSNWQSESQKNANQVVRYRMIKDPRDQGIQVSESLLVDVKFAKGGSEPWARYSLSATEWDWEVRRPGDYSAKCLTGEVTGNVDIAIDFSGFGDLSSLDASGQTIEAYYGAFIGDQMVGDVDWLRASDFNARPVPIQADPQVPTHWGLWNKICVKSGTSANDYSDDAVITFGIINSASWSDPDIPPED